MLDLKEPVETMCNVQAHFVSFSLRGEVWDVLVSYEAYDFFV